MAYINIKRKQDLVKLKNKLQKRFLQERVNTQDVYQDIEKVYKPFIDPLKKIAEETTETKTELKQIREVSRPAIESASKLAIEAPPPMPIINFGPIPVKYLQSQLNKKDSTFDYTYGIKWDGNKTKLGRKEIEIQGNDIVVDGDTFDGTIGLWELITKTQPENYTTEDKQNYEALMFQTLPFLNENDTVRANRGEKYQKIIKPLYLKYKMKSVSREVDKVREMKRRSSFSGSGIQFIPSDNNALLKRHKLLISAVNAGNSGVFNELQAINHELYKNGIFNETDIKNMNNFLFFRK